MSVTFRVNGGTSADGDCVVIHYGDVEFWIPWRQARRLARSMERECAKCANEEREIAAVVQRGR